MAWDRFLLEAGGDPRAARPGELAELGFLTEVAEFREPGGKMDHYAAAFGGVVRLAFDDPSEGRTGLDPPPGEFVLGDSLEKKDTTGTLGSVKDRVLDGVARLRRRFPDFSLARPLTPELERALDGFERAVRDPLRGAFVNRDLTAAGVALFGARPFDESAFGELMTREQGVLRDALGVSTRKLDRMLDAALGAGALGGKLNGSGGGGCMFAYAPGRAGEVAAAIEKAGGKAYIIRVDEGAGSRVEPCSSVTIPAEGIKDGGRLMIDATQIRKGMLIIMNGHLYRVMEMQLITPGRWKAMVQTKLRNVNEGSQMEHRFRSEERLEQAHLEELEMEFLYEQAGEYFLHEPGDLRNGQARDRSHRRRPSAISCRTW